MTVSVRISLWQGAGTEKERIVCAIRCWLLQENVVLWISVQDWVDAFGESLCDKELRGLCGQRLWRKVHFNVHEG